VSEARLQIEDERRPAQESVQAFFLRGVGMSGGAGLRYCALARSSSSSVRWSADSVEDKADEPPARPGAGGMSGQAYAAAGWGARMGNMKRREAARNVRGVRNAARPCRAGCCFSRCTVSA
jgi:hypothetical protein